MKLVPRRTGPHPRQRSSATSTSPRSGTAATSPSRTRTIVVALAAAAGVAIENARLYEEAARRERWLDGDRRDHRSAGRLGLRAPRRLQAVADRAREVAGADVAWMVAGQDAESLILQVVSGVEADLEDDGGVCRSRSRWRPAWCAPASRWSSRTSRTTRGPSTSPPCSAGPSSVRPSSCRCAAPPASRVRWRSPGPPPTSTRYQAVDAALPASFAEQAALALEVTRAREDQQRLALFEDRDRIGRDLHDLVIQRLFAVGLEPPGRRPARRPRSGRRRGSTPRSTTSTRRSRTSGARSSRSASLDESADIQAEVTRMVDRGRHHAEVPADAAVRGPGAHPDQRDRGARRARRAGRGAVQRRPATPRRRPSTVHLAAGDEITADRQRRRPRDPRRGGRERADQHAAARRALGGRCTVTSRPGAGTTVEWSVPAT